MKLHLNQREEHRKDTIKSISLTKGGVSLPHLNQQTINQSKYEVLVYPKNQARKVRLPFRNVKLEFVG